MTETSKPPEKVYYSVKEFAAAIEHSEDYVTDMKKGGFRLPATKSEGEQFIRDHGPVRRFRSRPMTRMELYGHNQPERPSCGNGATADRKSKRSRH